MPPGAKGRGRRAAKHVQTTTVPPRPWGRDLFNYLCLHWPSHTLRERQARGKNNKKKRANPELNILFQPMPENRPNQRAGCNVSPFELGSGATRKSNIRREKRCVAVWRWGRNEKKTARKRYDRRQGTSKLTDAGTTFACLKRVTYTHSVCRFL